MSSINSISVEKLVRLIGTPKCPVLVDVRTDEDYDLSPNLLPGSVRRPYADVGEWSAELGGQHAQRMGQELARLLRRVLAEQLGGAHALRGCVEQLGDRGQAHVAAACAPPCICCRSASAWKNVRQATITSSMSPSITACRLCRVSPMR